MKRQKNKDVDPDEIFADASNMPGFNLDQFEGRFEKAIGFRSVFTLSVIFALIFLFFTYRVFEVQIIEGDEHRSRSENNKLRHTFIFPDRGIIYDKNNQPLVWNEHHEDDFNRRQYILDPGFSNLLGYISYPKKDTAGFYYDEEITGMDGAEKYFDDILKGENGTRLSEINAQNEIIAENTTDLPQNGKNVHLTIDYHVQKKLYESVKKISDEAGFAGGGAVIMDIYNGDILAMVNYPEYDSNIMSDGQDIAKINEYRLDSRFPFLNRVVEGLYTPGSIVKPYMAIAALQEKVIGPKDKIISRKELVIPNPYDPSNPSIFTDWKAHGPVDVKEALAYSSNAYFYVVGGGYDDIEGLGISKIEKYMKKFGFGQKIESQIFDSPAGLVPNPQWKKENQKDEWRLGDTYFTSIGQYSFQVTPLQIVRGVSAIATNGMLVEPNLIADSDHVSNFTQIEGIDDWVWKTVQEGMRDAVLIGTSKGLKYDDFVIATKSGTAELGETKAKVNSWLTGYWPYENPRYAFAIFLEKGDRTNLIGGVAVARNFFDWLKVEKPEYLE